jgi:hypothetical protein
MNTGGAWQTDGNGLTALETLSALAIQAMLRASRRIACRMTLEHTRLARNSARTRYLTPALR